MDKKTREIPAQMKQFKYRQSIDYWLVRDDYLCGLAAKKWLESYNALRDMNRC